MQLLVSIIIPTKNRRDLLRETLASVAAQSHEAWEAVVVDDGSTDGSEELVREIAATDRRVRFVRRERNPRGAATCRNIGLAAAHGQYVLFLDSDDLLAAQCLARRVQFMEQNPGLDFAVFLTRIFHAVPGDSPYLWNLFTDEDDLDRFLRRDLPWHTSSPLWRKTSLARIGPWDESAVGAQDWEFHIRAIAAGLNYVKVPEADAYWRATQPGSISSLWKTRRHVCNRIRLFHRVAAVIRSRGLLTERRRRILAGEFYEHAFRMGQDPRLTAGIWRAGWRMKIVRSFEFATILSCEKAIRLAWRVSDFFEKRLFPERRLDRKHTLAVLPPGQATELNNSEIVKPGGY